MFLSSSVVLGWNRTGHTVAAYITYRSLSAKTKTQIDKILRHHSDYSRWVEGQPKDNDVRALTSFLFASTWSDDIRGDGRFYDENGSRPPTPVLPGFPDMKRHREWHFIEMPFSPDGIPVIAPHVPNIASTIEDLIASLANSKSSQTRKAYDLVWLIHLVADIHQPLHTVSWVTKSRPSGDRQGNDVIIGDPAGNLHRFWDDLVGMTVDRKDISVLAVALMNEPKPLGSDDLNVQHWMEENLQVARQVIYTFDYESSGTTPIMISQSYKSQATLAAHQRIVLAGYRLAAILNQSFDRKRSH